MPDDFSKKLGNMVGAIVTVCVMALVMGVTLVTLIWLFRKV